MNLQSETKYHTDITMNDDTKDDIKYLVKRFTDDENRVCSERSDQSLHNTLRKLSNDPLIKECKFDKGNGVAILESEDYCAKLNKIIHDKTKFVEIRQDTDIHPIIQKENSVSYYVKKYLNKVNDFEKLIPVGSKPGKLYGMAKVHKNQVPLRPVVSMVGTPEYNLAKYPDKLIKPFIPDTYLLWSTNDFI